MALLAIFRSSPYQPCCHGIALRTVMLVPRKRRPIGLRFLSRISLAMAVQLPRINAVRTRILCWNCPQLPKWSERLSHIPLFR